MELYPERGCKWLDEETDECTSPEGRLMCDMILAMPSPSRTGWVRESAIHTEKDAFTAPTPKPSRRRKSCPSTRWQKPTNVLPRCRQSSTKASSTQILES